LGQTKSRAQTWSYDASAEKRNYGRRKKATFPVDESPVGGKKKSRGQEVAKEKLSAHRPPR